LLQAQLQLDRHSPTAAALLQPTTHSFMSTVIKSTALFIHSLDQPVMHGSPLILSSPEGQIHTALSISLFYVRFCSV